MPLNKTFPSVYPIDWWQVTDLPCFNINIFKLCEHRSLHCFTADWIVFLYGVVLLYVTCHTFIYSVVFSHTHSNTLQHRKVYRGLNDPERVSTNPVTQEGNSSHSQLNTLLTTFGLLLTRKTTWIPLCNNKRSNVKSGNVTESVTQMFHLFTTQLQSYLYPTVHTCILQSYLYRIVLPVLNSPTCIQQYIPDSSSTYLV